MARLLNSPAIKGPAIFLAILAPARSQPPVRSGLVPWTGACTRVMSRWAKRSARFRQAVDICKQGQAII
jgi:hypothetical protein